MKALAELVGARLQRVDGPHSDLLALSFFGGPVPDKGVLAFWTPRGGQAAWAWLEERPRGAPANAWVQLLRKHVGNRRLSAVEDREATVALVFGDAELRVCARPANVQLWVGGTLRGRRHIGDEPATGALVRVPADRMAFHMGSVEREQRLALAKLARRRLKSLRRRLRAIDEDLRAGDQAPDLRHRGSLIVAHLHQAVEGASEIVVTDWNEDPPATRRLAIRAGKSAKEEADALFHHARKRDRGAEIALTRHEKTMATIARIEGLLVELTDESERAGSAPALDLDRIARALDKDGARPQRAAAHRASPGAEARLPFRRFTGAGGREIRVGRSAPENDLLTLHHAKPWDHWLHARGVSGSHVVVPLTRNESIPDGLLLDAAHLAAHFSRLRGEPIVEIQHVARRHVVKPRGAAAGSVRVRKETVLALRLEAVRLSRLLETDA
ncbi:MAG: NFACT RNA binding domain-containing protein [Sandaracinaceae bacterium]